MKTLTPNTSQQIATPVRTVSTAGATSGSLNPASGTTVLHQTILTNRSSSSVLNPVTITPTTVVQAVTAPQTIVSHVSTTPTVVVPVESAPPAAPVAATLQPTAIGSTVTVSTTPEQHLTTPVQVTEEKPDSPDMSDVQSTPDATRTYAMRPRKTN